VRSRMLRAKIERVVLDLSHAQQPAPDRAATRLTDESSISVEANLREAQVKAAPCAAGPEPKFSV
jgi:hypothetical protein